MITIENREHGKLYTITPDDIDGDDRSNSEMTLFLRSDMDIFIKTDNVYHNPLRFREPWVGGGMYPKTYEALRNLLKAIEEDKHNIENGIR